MNRLTKIVAALAALATLSPSQDRDGDGLSDFQEIHKYRTDPARADSDGDGIPDSDWRERREYQYTVRSVVQVMKPVTIEYLNDDYQDARVLDEAGDYVELEVIHYPFNTVADAIAGNAAWRTDAEKLPRWLESGPTADWTPALRTDLLAALAADGIDVGALDDKAAVEQVAAWLLRRAEYHDGFSSFITAFDDDGNPYVPEHLEAAADRGRAEKGLSLQQQWAREISARGMFENRARGSCTSSAIYLCGCLRAVGIPTRIVLCIPIVDASDPRELELVGTGLRHHGVRRTVQQALSGMAGSWASHTFNEVFVGGRWRRLNYGTLGQDIHDRQLFGLITHIATFRDWADANMPATVGRRQGLQLRDDVFGGPNPYSTISLRDEFGAHCDLDNPAPETESVAVAQLFWTDSDELPGDIQEGLARRNRFGLIARVTGIDGPDALRRFLAEADGRVFLEAREHATLKVGFDAGCWWYKNEGAYIYVPFGAADRRDLVTGPAYRFRPRNASEGYLWAVPDALRIARR